MAKRRIQKTTKPVQEEVEGVEEEAPEEAPEEDTTPEDESTLSPEGQVREYIGDREVPEQKVNLAIYRHTINTGLAGQPVDLDWFTKQLLS